MSAKLLGRELRAILGCEPTDQQIETAKAALVKLHMEPVADAILTGKMIRIDSRKRKRHLRRALRTS